MSTNFIEISNAINSIHVEKKYKIISKYYHERNPSLNNMYLFLDNWFLELGISIVVIGVGLQKTLGYTSYYKVNEVNKLNWTPGKFAIIEDYSKFKNLGDSYKVSYEYILNHIESNLNGWPTK
ncbi:MAG: hypothetical protein KDC49_05590 [Saprospiraceae bacterium]|nr:hypothetical protein [Saprospiraceae bacterium]